jgi:2-methylcitrate dehydratase PrpD
LLSLKGFTGIENILEAEFGGFCSTLCDRADVDLITQNLGDEFTSLNVGFKLYPCCANNHTSLDALRNIRQRNPNFTAEDVHKIVIRTTRSSKLHVGWPYTPDSITTAQMNLSYCLAAALIDGDFSVAQVTEEAVHRDDILETARRIEVVGDLELDGLGDRYRYAVKVEVFLRDGTSISEKVLQAKGSEANPASEAELEDKFGLLASSVLMESQVDRLYDFVRRLEQVEDVSALRALIVPQE